MLDWLTDHKLPVGRWSKMMFDWLNANGGPFFDLISRMMQAVIDAILGVLGASPPLLIIAILAGLAWYLQRSWRVAALVVVGFAFILNQGYWRETMQSLTLILLACVTCMAIGVPLGIAAAHRPRLYQVMSPILDLMQTLPTFVYLIPAIVFFGLGMVPGLIATVIFVLPAPIRLTHLGVSSTPLALKEAATAFGATPRQRLWKVELPWAFPQIMTGLNQTIMLSLSMVVIAALVGANGLGVPVVRALNTVNTALGFESGFIIVVVAIILDRMLRVTRK
ncbi:choline ABC transporter permease subunit [Cereibacter azotoformans]|uniref:Glycine betaine/proline transport system permease protein n=1 Tax=Cereibacter azotoformans TaxID=43057 RepID=A0A2T5KBZ2_9RHOB|nr:choline ABC transporter permease subunit [Cereibacter azotoformans]AXQ94193.1 choline ABC transporter permease subunit [Cereibacter sphaeroides]MBO4167999.1 choline ABC transporter permease subunit [Cereibacter azotoformans]PTR19931.1 glycine betaine/proline transport system permease protein [Cereibacter azotoformans]UIJ29731.1 choline ABC transporter permease subunit [Cereibacter azotoformans]